MFDGLPTTVHHLGPSREASRHPIHRGFVLVADEPSVGAFGASVASIAGPAGRAIDVADNPDPVAGLAGPAPIQGHQTLASRTTVGVGCGVVLELGLGKVAAAPGWASIGLRHEGRDPDLEPNRQTFWFGAELAPAGNQVWTPR